MPEWDQNRDRPVPLLILRSLRLPDGRTLPAWYTRKRTFSGFYQ